MRNRALLLVAVVAVLAATAARGVSAASPTVTVRPSQFGRVLFDGRGFVLYAFTADRSGRSACAGACAKAWPPYTVRKRPTGRLLGAIRRADGSLQVTYAGRPLYYYVGDRAPGQILCQNAREFGGLWLVLRADGSLVR
jgi:predicted lipoprotein with Yx(FWY)xxD motif